MSRRWMLMGIVFISLALVSGVGWAAEKKPIKLGVVFIMSGKMGGMGSTGCRPSSLPWMKLTDKAVF